MVTFAQNLLHVKEAAQELGVHPNTVRRAVKTGELSAVRLGTNGHYRIRRQALERFLQPATPKETRHE